MGGKKKVVNETREDLSDFSRQQYDTIAGNVNRLMGQEFTPYSGQRVAGVSDLEREAGQTFLGQTEDIRGLLGDATSRIQTGAQYTPEQIQAQSFADADLSAYRNPFQEQVIDAQLADIERQRGQTAERIDADASKAAAFGGSRQAIQQAESDRNFADIAAETGANLRSQGFQQAAAMYQQDAARQMQADLANQQAGMSGAELRMRGAGLLGDMAGRMSDADMREAAMRGSLGELDRAQEQAELDAQYQSYLMAYDDPYRRAQIQLGLLGNTPMLQNNRATQTTSGGGLGSLLGGVGQVVGMFRGK
tara:strand:- start:2404 stop:3321 length:918 start_codon:yes stop_codon:yes gene_type:complete